MQLCSGHNLVVHLLNDDKFIILFTPNIQCCLKKMKTGSWIPGLLCNWNSMQALLCQAPKYGCCSQEEHLTQLFTEEPKIHMSGSIDSNLKVCLS